MKIPCMKAARFIWMFLQMKKDHPGQIYHFPRAYLKAPGEGAGHYQSEAFPNDGVC